MALRGKAMDPNAGSWTIDPVFDGSAFKFGYLVGSCGEALLAHCWGRRTDLQAHGRRASWFRMLCSTGAAGGFGLACGAAHAAG